MVSQLCGSDPGDYAPLINDNRGSSPLFSFFFFMAFHPNLDIRPIEIPWILLSSGGLDVDIARWSDIDCGVLVSRYWQRHGRDIRYW